MTQAAPRVRTLVCLSLLAYCGAILLGVLTPVSEIGWGHVVTAVVTVLAVIGLVARMIDSVVLPGERYAYLVTGGAGLNTLLLYLIQTTDPHARQVELVLFLSVGIIGGYGAYLGTEDIDSDG